MWKFSVVIPAYNSSGTIKDTIQSCLDQVYPPHEIIIVDDCSSDNTIDIIAKNFGHFGVEVVRLFSNQGVSTARNVGWARATGDYVAFLDSDDIWHPTKLEIVNDFLTRTNFKCLGHTYTDKKHLFENPPKNILSRKLAFKDFLIRNYFNTSCLVVKKDIVFRFNEKMRYTEDHDLILRISATSPILLIKANLTLLARPQLSKGGLSGSKIKMRLGEIKMYREAARNNVLVFILMPVLVVFSVFKHLIKSFR